MRHAASSLVITLPVDVLTKVELVIMTLVVRFSALSTLRPLSASR